MKVRKIITVVEETSSEMGQPASSRRAAAIAVIANPFANTYTQDLDSLIETGARLGKLLGERAVAALGVSPAAIESYGKAAMTGSNGELEHAAAILHPALGAPLRKAVEKGAALVPSNKKAGKCGDTLDVPLGHKDAAYVRSHFDGMPVQISDAPRANEILVAVAVADSGRPLPRVGGLLGKDAVGEDGLR